MIMDNCPVCDKKILQHARKIICCICNKIFHVKCLTLCDKDLYSLECARPEWFCEICLSYSLPFNHIDDNAGFYAAIRELSESTADSLRYLSEKVFQPFESDINSYDELTDNDPDINFYNSMSHNRSCSYYLESSFNDMIRKSNGKNTVSICHSSIRSIKKNIA